MTVNPLREPLEERVLVLAPLWRDAHVICRVLSSAGFACQPCAGIKQLGQELAQGAAAVMITEEALADGDYGRLQQQLHAQPPWSDLPVILLLSPGGGASGHYVPVAELLSGLNVTILRRPVATATLLSIVAASLRSRHRQYEIRAYLQEREHYAAELEQRVRDRTEKLQQMASELTRAEQQERHRISQILHDDLQQQLYGLQMQLTFLRDNASEAMLRELDAIAPTMHAAIKIVRDLSVDLSPPILYDEGLLQGLQWIASRMREQYRVHVSVEAGQSFPIADDAQRGLIFQIVRELLFNAVKHAGVTQIQVAVSGQNDRVRIDIIDQGSGFDTAILDEERVVILGRGLRSARERLRLIGGRLEIQSVPGKGTHATVFTPRS